jgi:hypothetical protein
MNWEPNEAGPESDPLSAGDFVQVHPNADPTMAHQGFVIDADESFIRLQMHRWVGAREDQPACCNVEVMYPMASVAFVAHVAIRPVHCLCKEAVS